MRGFDRFSLTSQTRRPLLARVVVCLLAAAVIVPFSAGPSAAITGAVDSSSFGLSANVTLLGASVPVAAQPTSAYPSGPASGSVAHISAAGLLSTGAVSTTSTGDPLADTAAASASVAGLGISTLAQIVGASAISSSCTADGASATANSSVAGLTVGGIANTTVPANPAPNTNISIPGVATIILNEQTPATVAGQHGLVVNALHVTLLGGVLSALGSGNIVVGHSSCTTTTPSVPSISSITPVQGPTTGGTTVTINGSAGSFLGADSVTFGGVAAAFTRVSTSQLTATTPANVSGPVSVKVGTTAGTSPAATQQFTYIPAPTVSGISPQAGPAAGGTTVTITGTNFSSGSTVAFGSTAATGVHYVNATTITANAPAGTSTQFVTVTTDGGTSATSAANAYTYLSVPTLTAVAPTSGPTTGGTVVTLTGTGFTAGSTVTVDGNSQPVTYVSSTSLKVTTPTDSAGGVPIVVTTPGGTSGSQTFTYLAVPTVSGLSPASGTILGGTTVTITGTGLGSVTAVSVDGTAATIGTRTATSLQISTPIHALPGPVGVVLTGPGTITTTAGTFTYTAVSIPPANAPVVTSISPTSGALGGGTTVTITGTDLTGATAVAFGSTTVTPTPAAVTATSITVTSPAATLPGPVAVTVTTPVATSAVSLGGIYTYNPLAPTIGSLTPNSGPAAGGTSVVITGTNFYAGSTVTLDGSISVPATYVSATELDVVMPPHAAGPFGLTVSNLTFTSGSKTFTYIATPTVTGLSPASGSTAGGTTVTVTGTNLGAVTTVHLGGNDVTPSSSSTSTSVIFTTPAHSDGSTTVLLQGANGLSLSAGTFLYVAPAPTIGSISPTSGPLAGGNTVTVTGTNLSTVTGVSVGGTAATNVNPSGNTSLTLTVPASTAVGATTLVVTGPGGSDSTTYTYNALPAVSGISPAQGFASGGTAVTITGSGFTGTTNVRFGATSASPTVVNDTTITVNSPAHAVGLVDVAVIGPNGTSATTAADGFTYIADTVAPTVSGLSPVSGTTAGGTTVTVNGTGFTGTTGVQFGGSAGTQVSVTNDTTLTVTSPAHAAGQVDVTVTNAQGTSTTVNADHFTYQTPSATPAITSVSPGRGPVGGGTSVTITGSGLTGTNAVSFGGAAATNITVVSDSRVTATAPAAPGGNPITVDVRVTATGGTSPTTGADEFSYIGTPIVSGLSPVSGTTNGGTTVVITGTDLTAASAVRFGSTDASSFTVDSDLQITAVSPSHAAGAVDVTVVATGGTSSTAGTGNDYTFIARPTVGGLSPSTGPVGGGTTVTITGTGFTGATGAAAVTFGGTNAANYTVVSNTTITAVSPAGTGSQDVVVSTPAGGTSATSGADLFSYVGAPAVSGLSPGTGPAAGGTTVTVTGTGFTGVSAVSFGGTAAGSFSLVNATTITATAPAGSGTVDVTVTTPYGTSPTSGSGNNFVYLPAPIVNVVSPGSGPSTGGTTVTLTGTDLNTVTAIYFGTTPAAGYIVNNDGTLSVTSPAGTGTVDITVVTPGGTSMISTADQFGFVPAPSVGEISPTSGPTAGGTTVTITGTGFLGTTGAAGVQFGSTNATSYTVVSDSTITAVAPAHGPSIQDVVVTTPVGGSSATSPADQYRYLGVPTVTALSPAGGPLTGGGSVTVTGTGFTSGSTVAFGGTAGTAVTFVSAGQLTVTVPAGPAGTVDVTVTTPYGTSSTSGSGNDYTYLAVPVVTGIAPGTGPEAGGTAVTVTGTDLGAVTAVRFGSTATTGLVVNSDTSLTVNSPAGTGTADVTVVTPGGTSGTSGADHFVYVPAPAVTAVSPVSGPTTGGTVVTITGTDLTGATGVTFGSTTVTPTTVSATSITVTSPSGPAGTQDVTVTTPDGGISPVTAADRFTYLGPPTVTGLAPTTGPAGGGTTVTITGTGFTSTGSTVAFNGTAATSVAFVNSTTLTAVAPAGSGVEDVTVTTPTATSSTAGAGNDYTYIAGPTISGLSPATGPEAGGTTVTILGAGFSNGSTVSFGGTAGTSVVVVNSGQITVATPAGTGIQTVTVTAAGGTSAAGNTFTYVAAPVVIGMSPTSGPASGGTLVTITGSGFTGATGVSFGSNTVNPNMMRSTALRRGSIIRPAVVQPATVTATQITVLTPSGSGTQYVTVTTPNGGTSSPTPVGRYTYVGAPTVTGLSPAGGPTGGGGTVTITGTDFGTGSTVSFGGTAGTSVVVVNATTITVTAPAGTAGVVDVTVTTPSGTSPTAGSGNNYTYVAAATVSVVTPGSGPIAGGTTVTITGTGFHDATGVLFGATAATSYSIDSDTQITATAPAHPAGVTDVTVTGAGGPSGTSTADQFTFVTGPTVTGVSPSGGPTAGGGTVTITGTGFTGTTAVRFGTVAATSFTVVNATTITAIVPAGAAGVDDVRVTTPGGVSTVTPDDEFTYGLAGSVSGLTPAAGPTAGGTPVTITGTGFTGTTAVFFDTAAASSFTVNSDTSITAVSPAHAAGSIDVTVVGRNGTSVTSTSDVFIYAAPNSAPVITGVSPARGPAAGGTPITISGINFTGATGVTFDGVPGTDFTVVNDTTITVTVPANGNGAVDVVVTGPNGSSQSTAGSTYTYVPLTDAPTITSISPTAGPVSGGTRLTITGARFDEITKVTFDGVPGTDLVLGPDISTGSFAAADPARARGTASIHRKVGAANATAGRGVRASYAISLSVTSPPHVQGLVTVAVTNAAGSFSVDKAFAFIPVPAATTISLDVPVSTEKSIAPKGPDYAGIDVTGCSATTGAGRAKIATDKTACVYTAPAKVGKDSFTMAVVDLLGQSAVQTVKITVVPADSTGGGTGGGNDTNGGGSGKGKGNGNGSGGGSTGTGSGGGNDTDGSGSGNASSNGSGSGSGRGSGSGSGTHSGRLAFTGAPYLLIPGLAGGLLLLLIGTGLLTGDRLRGMLAGSGSTGSTGSAKGAESSVFAKLGLGSEHTDPTVTSDGSPTAGEQAPADQALGEQGPDDAA